MAAGSELWERIEKTRNPGSEEQHLDGRFPFGLVKMLEVKWSVQGLGEMDTEYSLLVAEYRPQGRLAALLRAEPSLTARLLQHTPGSEEAPPTHAAYTVEIVGDELRNVGGAVRVEESPEVPLSRRADPMPLNRQEAIAGFHLGLADANFAQA